MTPYYELGFALAKEAALPPPSALGVDYGVTGGAPATASPGVSIAPNSTESFKAQAPDISSPYSPLKSDSVSGA